MIERLVSHFDSLFLEIKTIENLLVKEKHSMPEALEVALRSCSLARNPCSEIQVIHSINRSIDINSYNQFELALFINQLLRKYELSNEFTVERETIDKTYGRLFDFVRVSPLFEQLPASTDEYLEEITKVKKSRSVKSLIQLAVDYFAKAHYSLQNDILDHIAIRTYLPKYNSENEITIYELEYYNKWIDGSIEFSDLIGNGHYDFKSYIH